MTPSPDPTPAQMFHARSAVQRLLEEARQHPLVPQYRLTVRVTSSETRGQDHRWPPGPPPPHTPQSVTALFDQVNTVVNALALSIPGRDLASRRLTLTRAIVEALNKLLADEEQGTMPGPWTGHIDTTAAGTIGWWKVSVTVVKTEAFR